MLELLEFLGICGLTVTLGAFAIGTFMGWE